MFWKNDDKADQFKKIAEKMELSVLWFGASRTLWRLVDEGHVSRDVVLRLWASEDAAQRNEAARAVPEMRSLILNPLDAARILDTKP